MGSHILVFMLTVYKCINDVFISGFIIFGAVFFVKLLHSIFFASNILKSPFTVAYLSPGYLMALQLTYCSAQKVMQHICFLIHNWFY
jgi:hypothetical protein